MNTKYFSLVADYVPKGGAFPTDGHRVELTIKDAKDKSEVFRLHIEEAPLSHGELFSFRIKSGGLATARLPGWLFLTTEAVDHIEWDPASGKVGKAVLQLPKGEGFP
jgi:hypothetical protein